MKKYSKQTLLGVYALLSCTNFPGEITNKDIPKLHVYLAQTYVNRLQAMCGAFARRDMEEEYKEPIYATSFCNRNLLCCVILSLCTHYRHWHVVFGTG